MSANKSNSHLKGKRTSRRQVKRFLTEEAVSKLSESSLAKRKQIIEAAVDCFLELGYEGTSMNAVADRAGVIKQTIYSHFDSKEKLFTSAIHSITMDYVRGEIAAADVFDKSPRHALLTFAKAIFRRHDDPRFGNFQRTMFGETERFPELAKIFTEATIKPSIELVTGIFSNKDEFEVDDPEALARIFISSIVHYCMQQNLLRGREILPFEQERLLKQLMRIIDMHRKMHD
ncbi:MAG TPA: TetR/AcrR family transcriptional regulator [Planktothrix sp.]